MKNIWQALSFLISILALVIALHIMWSLVNTNNQDEVVDVKDGSSVNGVAVETPLHEETLPLIIKQGHDTVLRISVAPEYKGWVLEELRANKGVRNIYEKTYLKENRTGNDIAFEVFLTPRIGRNDLEKLLALPEKLDFKRSTK